MSDSVTPWTVALQAPLSFNISRSLLKFMSVELVMLSNHLILCCPLLLPSIFPSIRGFSNELALYIRSPKYWNFSFSINPSNEYSGLISWINWKFWLVWSPCSLRDSKVFSAPQSESINSSVLSLLHGPILISICVGKVMSLLFNTLSRFVIALLPRSKRLLYFMAAVAICSDFGAQENKICHCFHFPPLLFAMK